MRRAVPLTILILAACGPQTDADPEATDGGDSGTTQAVDESDSTGDPGDESGGSSGGPEGSTTDEPMADSSGGESLCGNGRLDPGEECDDDSDECIECNIPCGLGPMTDLIISQVSLATQPSIPFAAGDGSGDLLLDGAYGVSRVDTEGTPVWVNTTMTADWVTDIARVDTEHFWLAGTPLAGDTSPSILSLHDMSDGEEIRAVEFPHFGDDQYTIVSQVEVLEDGRLLLLLTEWLDVDTQVVTLQWRSADGMRVQASASVPFTHGVGESYAPGFDRSADGSLYLKLGDQTGDGQAPLVVKTDAEGTEQWRRELMPVDPSLPVGAVYDVIELDGGSVAALGVRRQTLHPANLGNLADGDGVIVRMTAEGEVEWELPSSAFNRDAAFQLHGLVARDDELVLSGAWLNGGAVLALTATIDATEGAIRCAQLYTHPSEMPTLGERMFTWNDDELWLFGSRKTANENTNASTGVWAARVY